MLWSEPDQPALLSANALEHSDKDRMHVRVAAKTLWSKQGGTENQSEHFLFVRYNDRNRGSSCLIGPDKLSRATHA